MRVTETSDFGPTIAPRIGTLLGRLFPLNHNLTFGVYGALFRTDQRLLTAPLVAGGNRHTLRIWLHSGAS